MIKVPATQAGIPVIRALIGEGINVNATLIFSIDRYQEVIEAYLLGLEDRVKQGLAISHIHSVASFFVSRIDTAVDQLLEDRLANGEEKARNLMGKIAIDNARMAFQTFKSVFSGSRFEALAKKGAQIQRPLWASTGTKNPSYSDCLYVDELIGANTVNTIPASTLDAFLDHGVPSLQIEHELKESIGRLDTLIELGINLWEVTDKLEAEGVLAFQKAHQSLLSTIDSKRSRFSSEVDPIKDGLKETIKTAVNADYINRLFEHDPSLWTDDQQQHAEIMNRLGWLELPGKQFGFISDYQAFLKQALEEGFTDVFVLGMGGSSLAPEVLAQSFKNQVAPCAGLRLRIIDTTNPKEISDQLAAIDLEHTLFVVASKSGGTSETMAAYHFFANEIEKVLGQAKGKHFIAITDPGSSLADLAQSNAFRAIFYSPASVGGRFSAFTPFGLIPATLIGIDLDPYLLKADFSDRSSRPVISLPANANAMLGLVLGSAALQGKNKLTFIAEDFGANLVPWLEQLIAESSGKEGKGILPVENEPILDSFDYPSDRLFVYLEVDGSKAQTIQKLEEKGYAVLHFKLEGPNDLAREFYRWEYATAIACAVLGVNAFDQPDVQSNKLVTKEVIAQYKESGNLNEGEPIFNNHGFKVYGNMQPGLDSCNSLDEIIAIYAKDIPEGGYIALNAYLPRQCNEIENLQALRARLLNKYNVATTLGFGPRFLHSTGQFHKGGPDGGLYIILTRKNQQDLDIPGEGMSFGTMQLAQALGDFEVLQARGKQVLRIDLPATE